MTNTPGSRATVSFCIACCLLQPTIHRVLFVTDDKQNFSLQQVYGVLNQEKI